MRKPIEASPFFIKLRPRLFHQVPVLETLKFIEMFSDNYDFYPRIKYFVKRVTEGAQRFFIDEIYELSLLKRFLDFGRYKITSRGRIIMRTRLHLTYEDGVKYNIAANMIREFKIKPIRDLEPKIIESQSTASAAKSLSRKIGKEIGIKI